MTDARARAPIGAPRPIAPVGIGLRLAHHAEWLARRPALDVVEVHAENFFAEGGAAPALLDEVRRHHPISLHGVGLSLGSACGLDEGHLARLAALVQRLDPMLVSDHVAFARAPLVVAGAAHASDAASPGPDAAPGMPSAPPIVHAADLLPVAFTPASLAILCANVERAQAVLGRRLLLENLSAYLAWADDTVDEPAFLAELCRRTGCGLLLDLNNLVVNALNRGAADPLAWARSWISRLPAGVVGQIHLAGHTLPVPGRCVVDDHGQPVGDTVWQLHAHALRHCGPVTTVIEWDTDLPPLQTLLDEARHARELAEQVWRETAAADPQHLVWPQGPGAAQQRAGSAPGIEPPATATASEQAVEAARQQALLGALFTPGPVELDALPSPTHPVGQDAPRWTALPRMGDAAGAAPTTDAGLLTPYRRNAAATAARALHALAPTVAAMLGEETLRAVAWALWLAHPPRSGDLADWGSELPAWLQAQPSLREWPWLADSARLDLAVHHSARAADAQSAPQTLALLGERPAHTLRLVLRPGTAVLCSDWPVATLREAHQTPAEAGNPAGADDAASADAAQQAGGSAPADEPAQGAKAALAPASDRAAALAAARQALARRAAECVCVHRSGWAVTVQRIDRATAAWMADLLAGLDLAQALQRAQDRAAESGAFDFTAWLAAALRAGWVLAAEAIPDATQDC